jgi:uncharacterized UPF0146 family protein
MSPMAVSGYRKIRLGDDLDGGYVIVDNLVDRGCCVSVGIGGNVSFDRDLAMRGYDIFQYDHTVPGPPTSHERFHFTQVGLAAKADAHARMTDLAEIVREREIARYRRPILKIDIEDAEWSVLEDVEPPDLMVFDQICLEFHGLDRLAEAEFAARVEAVFRVVTAHHVPVHVHGNNWGGFPVVHGVPVPEVLEITLTARHGYAYQPTEEIFPGLLDRPNKVGVADLFLGRFQF